MIVQTAAEDVEAVRKIVNQLSSEVPQELLSAFQASIDQLADQQYNVSKILSLFIQEGPNTLAVVESSLTAAVVEARRTGLRACRGYADLESKLSADIEGELLTVPVNVSELEREKLHLDKKFSVATALHEDNRIEALDQLVSIANSYKEWRTKSRATIAGTHVIKQNEDKKLKLQTIAIWVAIGLGVANTIIQLVK